MKIEVLMIGKVADKPYTKLVNLYLDRCGRRLPVKIICCKNEDEMVKRAEAREYVIALDEHATCRDTDGFCKWLGGIINTGNNKITFCLGAASGLDPRIKALASEKLSLSPLTLNHQLALLVLAEQLYRSVSIMFGEPYHKA